MDISHEGIVEVLIKIFYSSCYFNSLNTNSKIIIFVFLAFNVILLLCNHLQRCLKSWFIFIYFLQKVTRVE